MTVMYLLLFSKANGDNRPVRSGLVPVLLGIASCASYSCFSSSSIAEAPWQAAWVSTGIALCASLIQSVMESTEEVGDLGEGFNEKKDENRNTLRVTSTEQILKGLRIAIVLMSRYWAATTLGPTRYRPSRIALIVEF
jgi:hypothetical protein